MTIARLDTPLRVTWDLHGSGGAMASAAAVTVAERLVEAGLFYVTLGERPCAHPAIAELVSTLVEGGLRTQAVFGGTEAEWRGLDATPQLREILVDAAAFVACAGEDEWNALRRIVERLREHGLQPALLLVPDRRRLPLLPEFLAFCRAAGITRFTLPNTPVDASFPDRKTALLPDAGQLAELRDAVTDPVALRAGITLEVHDLFLWEIFFPGERESGRSEYGGCQAANSLAHVDAAGIVHPCSSWQEPLGSLLEEPFEALWQRPQRDRVLARIGETPSGCAGCRDYALCFGGCRGLVETFAPLADGRDLLCPERR